MEFEHGQQSKLIHGWSLTEINAHLPFIFCRCKPKRTKLNESHNIDDQIDIKNFQIFFFLSGKKNFTFSQNLIVF